MITKTCEVCGGRFDVRPYRASTARFCSQRCGGSWHARTRLAHAPKPWMRGNKLRAGRPPANKGRRGPAAWNRGVRGIHLSPRTEFKPGQAAPNKVALGTERTRRHAGDGPRVWVKTGEPNEWRPRAVVVWESINGAVPDGFVVHHENRNPMDDRVENLSLRSRADHLNEHRAELAAKRVGAAK